jgi:CAAX prenyl protease-like protein
MKIQQETPKSGEVSASTVKPEPSEGLFNKQSIPRILPFGIYMSFIVIADLFSRAGLQGGDLLWLYPVKIAAVLAALWWYRSCFIELAWRSLTLRQWIEVIVTGVVVLVLWVNLNAPWMQVGHSPGYAPLGADGQINWLLVVCRIVGAALIVPVMEELFWRSFLMRWLQHHDFLSVRPESVRFFAFCVAALLFGIEHNLWVAGVVAGVAYGILYMRSGNLWSPIIAHAITNGLLGAWILVMAEWTYW